MAYIVMAVRRLLVVSGPICCFASNEGYYRSSGGTTRARARARDRARARARARARPRARAKGHRPGCYRLGAIG